MFHLSKSDYLKFRIHPAYLWYHKHTPKKLPPFDDNQRYFFEQGNRFESLVQKLFPSGVFIEGEHYEFEKIATRTQETIAQDDWSVMFQPGFFTQDRLFCRSDIIEKSDHGWVLNEVKSSTGVKDAHLHDLAFQKIVIEQSGHTVISCRVLHVNKFYHRKQELNPESLVASRDVTEEVDGLIEKVKKEIKEAQSVVELAEVNDHPAFAGNLGEWMPIYEHLHGKAAESVLNLTSIKPQQVRAFYENGIERLDQIREDGLNDRQKWQVRAVKAGKPLINEQGITDFINSLTYPLYFLDYETSGFVIPHYKGAKPYQQVPFQYSLHKLESPDAELEHFEYLHTDGTNSAEAISQKLISEIGTEGTILAWFDKFEKFCNRTLASMAPEYADALHAINARMKDLRIPFANFSYVDGRFGGSTSIKNVLPVVVPDLSYKKLGIQEGGSAQRLWQQAIMGEKTKKESEKIFSDLLEYCKLDTLAMVEIYRTLRGLSGDSSKAQSSLF